MGMSELLALKEENTKLKIELGKAKDKYEKLMERGFEILREKESLMNDPEVARQMAEMDLQLKIAERFVKSGAFNVGNAEEAYVIIQAGKEINLKPMESMQTFYIHNGRVLPHSKGMVSVPTRNGWVISYSKETTDTVQVTMTNGDQSYSYFVDVANEPTLLRLQKSGKFNALKTDRKNKLRYHGIRQIINFHLPHLFGSAVVWDRDDIDSANETKVIEKTNQEVKKALMLKVKSSNDMNFLSNLYRENEDLITQDIELTKLFASKKEAHKQKQLV